MHTRTKRRQKKLGHVLLYPLPEAIAAVKQLAFSAGLMDAVTATRKGEGTYDATTVQVAALNQCAQFQTHHMDGKTGTNNPRLFKELFIPTYTHGREALARVLTTADAALLHGLPRDLTQLATYFYTYAQAHTDLVENAFVGYALTLAPFS